MVVFGVSEHRDRGNEDHARIEIARVLRSTAEKLVKG
jgi:hypothetical protein